MTVRLYTTNINIRNLLTCLTVTDVSDPKVGVLRIYQGHERCRAIHAQPGLFIVRTPTVLVIDGSSDFVVTEVRETSDSTWEEVQDIVGDGLVEGYYRAGECGGDVFG